MKEGGKEHMVLFIVLAIIVLLLALVTIAVVSVGGAAFIILFGDVIVCIWIIIKIMKAITKKKK